MRWIISAYASVAIGVYSAQAASWWGDIAVESVRRGTAIASNARVAAREIALSPPRRRTRGDSASTIALRKKRAAVIKSGFADNLAGGPDFWEVTGVGTNDWLSLRKEASPRAILVAQFPSETVLRNLGCKISRGQRWCKVEQPDDPFVRGWVNGRYLRETAGRQ